MSQTLGNSTSSPAKVVSKTHPDVSIEHLERQTKQNADGVEMIYSFYLIEPA